MLNSHKSGVGDGCDRFLLATTLVFYLSRMPDLNTHHGRSISCHAESDSAIFPILALDDFYN